MRARYGQTNDAGAGPDTCVPVRCGNRHREVLTTFLAWLPLPPGFWEKEPSWTELRGPYLPVLIKGGRPGFQTYAGWSQGRRRLSSGIASSTADSPRAT